VVLATGTCDSGTGSSFALSQIAANVLGISAPHIVTVVEGDSALGPSDVGSSAQRSVFLGGQAAYRAALACRQALIKAAAGHVRKQATHLDLAWPLVVVSADRQTVCSVTDLLPELGGRRWAAEATPQVTGTGASVCAIRVVVSTEPACGLVRVEEVTAVVDCGLVVSPSGAYGQVAGAISQGIGLALIDSYDDFGIQSIMSHGVPRASDIPAIRVIFVRAPQNLVSSGLGELAIVAAPAAVANAFSEAVGTMTARLPLRPEEIAGYAN
jgi:CO/xanthine dehydrogenase Mo-binding subunit